MVATLRYPWDGSALILVVGGLYFTALAGASEIVSSDGYLLGTAAGVSAVVVAAALASHLHYTFEGR